MSTTLSTSIKPQFRTVDGLKIRLAESELRDDHALLMDPEQRRPAKGRSD